MRFNYSIPLLLICCILFLESCSNLKKVQFKTPVDTKSKTISYQVKTTYFIEDLDLYVDNLFDGARLNGVEKLNDSTALLKVQPENQPINNSAYYAFKTWSTNPKDVYFRFEYPKGYKHRYSPKIKRGNDWNLIDSSRVFKNDTIVTVKLNLTKDPIIVAAQEIQSTSDVKKWYSSFDNHDAVTIKKYGTSKLGRDLPVIELTKEGTNGKEVVILMTRQHPPEVTGYYAFQYFIETLLDNSELSTNFLEKYHVLVFPLINPDGVDLGHWRHNAGGVDTNRDWSVYNQPEIRQTVKYINKTVKKNKSRLTLGIDFHSTWYDIFYTNKIREGTTMPSFIDDWFSALETNINGYKVNERAGNSSKPVSKGWVLGAHNAVGITYEIGDATPKKDIKIVGESSAKEMMKILLQSK